MHLLNQACRIIFKFLWTVSLSFYAEPGAAYAQLPPEARASFDCHQKNLTAAQKIICTDRSQVLSKLDRDQADAYREALKRNHFRDKLTTEHQEWLKGRDACSQSGCLMKSYDLYLRSLNTFLDEHPSGQKKIKRYDHCTNITDWQSCNRTGQTGKGFPVCENFLKHLNKITENPRCHIPAPPGFKKPDWQELKIEQNLRLVFEIERQISQAGLRKDGPSDFIQWRHDYLEEMHSGRVQPRIRKVRIKPLGKEEVTIVAYTPDFHACEKYVMYQPSINLNKKILADQIGVYAGDYHFILPEKPDAVPQMLRGGSSSASHFSSELFLYRNNAYFLEIENLKMGQIRPEIDLYRFVLGFSSDARRFFEPYRTENLCQFRDPAHH